MNNLSVNDKIKWKSGAGEHSGIIKEISLYLNGKRELIPFLVINIDNGSSVRMCGVDGYLKMMRVEKIVDMV